MALVKDRNKQEAGPKAAAITGPPSRLGPEATVRGGLAAKGELTVEGTVQGDVEAERLILAPGGKIEGNVIAQEARISGHLDGSVIAPIVTIGTEATVIGKVFHHTISVAEGARLDARLPWRPMNYFEEGQYELQETRHGDVHA